MTLRNNGGYIGYNQIDTSVSATGIWSLDEVYRRRDEGNWPSYFAGTLLDSRSTADSVVDTWTQKTYTIDSTAVAGTTGRLVFHIYGTTTFTSDAQYDSITLPTSGGNVTYNFDSGNTHSFETTSANVGTDVAAYYGASFSTLSTLGAAGTWAVDSAGTPSTGTGSTVDHSVGTTAGYYVFFETSGTHPLSGFLRSPEVTLASTGTIEWYESAFGADLANSTRDVYWIPS